MMTIDKMRRLAKFHNSTPTYNGIGMIRLHLGGRMCLFYSDLSESINNTIHDHRFSYTSHIVKGVIRNTIYTYKKVNHKTHFTHMKKVVAANSNATRGKIERHYTPNIEITKVSSFDTVARHKYFLHRSSFHYVERQTSKLITIMIPEVQSRQRTSGLIIDDRVELDSPFNKPKSEDECWGIIEYTIND